MKIIYAFVCILLISHVASLEGYEPYEYKPADVEYFYRAAYLKILNSPKIVYDNCEPFYKRVFYNIDNIPESYRKSIERTHYDEEIQIEFENLYNLKKDDNSDTEYEQPLDMYIYFNTNISCPKSYVTVEIFSTKIFRFNCNEELLHLYINDSKWEQYVHRCRVFVPTDKATFVDAFTYQIYAQVASLYDKEKMLKLSEKERYSLISKLRISDRFYVELVRKYITTKMIVLGDWAPIKVRPYLPIHESLYHLIELRQKEKQTLPLKQDYRITGMVIAGDIAYNLYDFNCMKYNWFMSELEKVSPYWPIILFPGNHDDVTPGNRYLQTRSFEIGRLAVEDGNYTRVKWMRFPQLMNFVMFDPFWEIYNKATPGQTQQMTYYLKSTINEIQSKYPNEFTIAMSHYPIACSQMDDNHCNAMTLTPVTKDLLDFMSTYRNGKPRPVDMYVGSHMHQFERVFPYTNGSFYIGYKSTYGRGHMVSVVEGSAGCDYGIISEDFPRQNFSVSATYFKTGYAIMTIYETSYVKDKSKYMLNYVHYAAKQAPGYMYKIDEFTIYGQVPKKIDEISEMEELFYSFNEKLTEFGNKLSEWGQSLEQLMLTY